MRRPSAFVLHAIATGIMTRGWLNLLDETADEPMVAQKGGYFQFLTNQGLAVAWACMAVGLFCDLFPSVTVARHLKKALLMISLPLAFVISSIYWSLIVFLPHLILPPPATPGAPSKLLTLSTDLSLHASPLITLLIDFFVFEPKFSKAYVRTVAPMAIVAFSIWYASFVEYCASFNKTFPYPFLTHNPFPVRVLIYTITAGMGLACLRTLNSLHA